MEYIDAKTELLSISNQQIHILEELSTKATIATKKFELMANTNEKLSNSNTSSQDILDQLREQRNQSDITNAKNMIQSFEDDRAELLENVYDIKQLTTITKKNLNHMSKELSSVKNQLGYFEWSLQDRVTALENNISIGKKEIERLKAFNDHSSYRIALMTGNINILDSQAILYFQSLQILSIKKNIKLVRSTIKEIQTNLESID